EQLRDASVGLFGDRVHVAAREVAAAESRGRALLAAAGIEVQSIRPIEPSLEDVFVAVLAERSAAAAP
ncbi:MAG TPA: ABC transporter ATP-binding protein, partial [Opitutaceae bacterium]|nr:ABC transporter ATP-binding protein [Opitutaceae bacterium]